MSQLPADTEAADTEKIARLTALPAPRLPMQAARCQYEGLPIHARPPFGVLRPTRRIREHARMRLSGVPAEGRPSAYEVGSWVSVRSAEEVRATLDAGDRLGGLWFTASQWTFCGGVYQVEHVVRRMLDDHYRMRRISRTVTLRGATCSGAGPEDEGCGLGCALLFRDDWLTLADAPPAPPAPQRYATVRSLHEIQQTLGPDGTLLGVPFHAAMARHVGRRFPVARQVVPRALPRWQYPVGEWYQLDGLRCLGEPLAGLGCDRQCALLWHRSWLTLE
ncbi:hypothetical protein DN069_18925 [Streptacidiphilus pinicola]|uniref:Uncharacterized protein n=1 Tax=Streptacidiphilus pinicola TaxID=2219663 RepID=A0A2X0KAK3_9ACTN|nr:hypothetical protein [Streptacidiphilus pinicola]RAG84110.1 hypothetical protein DN069_18925 [Streptacidiphilus pinicola]